MAVQVAAPSSVGLVDNSKCRYDVFLSFKGDDTRNSFTMNLYNALRRKGINAFMDDKKLGKGKRILPALRKAIEKSRISIIVFSNNYATSTWCLDELDHIIRCKKEKNQVVMPIFYKVDPMDVQYQRNAFAMADHEERFRDDLEKMQKWRSALSEAASLSSAWLFHDGDDEGVFIKIIVEDAYAMLPPKRFHNIDYIVGLETSKEEVMSLLDETDTSVRMLGIHGTGGIGKTTLAKAVYNSIFYHFEGSCFLFDVKEASKKYQGVVRLQQTLLSEILEEKIMMFRSVDEGISRIKHRLSQKKVLLVLDDVDEVEQLEQLAGGSDWFGHGSKIIITTRNRHLLIARNVEKTYEMMELNEHDSLELFCWHAFHRNQPPKDYQYMSSCAISYAQGLPLALRVVGSNLADKNIEEWRSILEQYERIPERTIHEVLKISYDGLPDGAKHIFLDIACFFDKVGYKEMVEACDFGARFYLEVLVDKSLITFISNECFFIHDLIQKMGRDIVRQDAPLNPEKRSRLWYYKDILEVFRENLGCNNIEGIMFDPPLEEKVKWNGKAFEKMNNLRILVVRNAQFSIGPTYLPNSLRWLEWVGYPSTTLPTDFSPFALVFLKLPRSSFRLKEPLKIFTNYVTHMNFSSCEFITEVPDMSQLQSLRRLEFPYCRNLIKVHDSVGSLSKLVLLSVNQCTKLTSFPREINMPSLQDLNLSYCRSLEYFPHVVGKMDALELILTSGTSIKELPPSIGNLSRLKSLYMYSCKRLSKLPINLLTLPNLETLGLGAGASCTTKKSLMKLLLKNIQPFISYYYVSKLHLSDCGLMDEELHLILKCFRNLQQLFIGSNGFVSVPKCIKECAQLQWLDARDCKRLRHMPAEFPPNWYGIVVENCTSLTAESLDNLYSQAKKEVYGLHIRMPPSTTFPDWFNYCCEGGTLCFRVRRNSPAVALAFELGKADTNEPHIFRLSISINGRNMIPHDLTPQIATRQGHVVLLDLSTLPIRRRQRNELNTFELSDWNDVEIQVTSDSPDISIERCGIYAYKPQTNMDDVPFKFPLLPRASLKRRATAPPPSYVPPNKFMRIDKGNLSNPKKRSRRIKRHQTFHSCYSRKMVFPMGKLVWKLLHH